MSMEGATPQTAPPFLDVATLVDASVPERRLGWMRYSFGIFLLIVITSAYLSNRYEAYAGVVQFCSSLLMLTLVCLMAISSVIAVRAQRREQSLLQSVEELIQLRRWPQAGVVLQELLSRPARAPWARVQGLIFLAGILARYHRFTEAIEVQEYLLDNLSLDGGTVHSLRLGRAMALLREDRLFDADQAINELRRQAIRANEQNERKDQKAGEESEEAEELAFSPPDSAMMQPPLEVGWRPILPAEPKAARSHESAGLVLVELYRDVKTGHPAEAEKLFDQNLLMLRQQLGHRVADAYALVARAYDLLSRPAEAAAAYEKATLLQPAAELHRRYPELAVLATKYPPAPAPQVG